MQKAGDIRRHNSERVDVVHLASAPRAVNGSCLVQLHILLNANWTAVVKIGSRKETQLAVAWENSRVGPEVRNSGNHHEKTESKGNSRKELKRHEKGHHAKTLAFKDISSSFFLGNLVSTLHVLDILFRKILVDYFVLLLVARRAGQLAWVVSFKPSPVAAKDPLKTRENKLDRNV